MTTWYMTCPLKGYTATSWSWWQQRESRVSQAPKTGWIHLQYGRRSKSAEVDASQWLTGRVRLHPVFGFREAPPPPPPPYLSREPPGAIRASGCAELHPKFRDLSLKRPDRNAVLSYGFPPFSAQADGIITSKIGFPGLTRQDVSSSKRRGKKNKKYKSNKAKGSLKSDY